MPARTLTVSVDRIEGKMVVLEGDDGQRFEIEAGLLGERPREGMIFHVPLGRGGNPDWKRAVPDGEEAERRRQDLGARMNRLRSKDTGGDIEV